ncbi:MAG: hypothetical protein AB8C46_24155 [Burkholderiaceae bacterium]
MKKWQRMVGMGSLALMLAACGGGDDSGDTGGGGNSSVPSSPTKSIANSEQEAQTLATGTIEGSGDNVNASRQQSRLDGFSRVAGATTGASGSTSQALKTGAMLAARIAGKETIELSCADIVAGSSDEPANEQIRDCSGSVTYDTNISQDSVDSTGTIAAGTFVSMTFNNLRYTTTIDGAISINGTIRIDYLESFVINPLSGRIKYTSTGLSGSSDGENFGPESSEYIISINGSRVEVIADGVRLTDFDANYTDANNYTISQGQVIDQIDGEYVEIDYSNWRVVDGVPQAGSSLVVLGTDGSATVSVLSNTGSELSIRISINAEGQTTDYELLINITNGEVSIS